MNSFFFFFKSYFTYRFCVFFFIFTSCDVIKPQRRICFFHPGEHSNATKASVNSWLTNLFPMHITNLPQWSNEIYPVWKEVLPVNSINWSEHSSLVAHGQFDCAHCGKCSSVLAERSNAQEFWQKDQDPKSKQWGNSLQRHKKKTAKKNRSTYITVWHACSFVNPPYHFRSRAAHVAAQLEVFAYGIGPVSHQRVLDQRQHL